MALFKEIKTIQKDLDYKKIKITGGNNVTNDFSDFKTFNNLSKDFHFIHLSWYSPRNQKYIDAKNKLSDNAKNFYEGSKKIIEGFKKGIFPLKSYDEFKEQQTSEKFNEKESCKKPTKVDAKSLMNSLLRKKKT